MEESQEQGNPVTGLSPDDLAAVRELVLRAHPAVVPELVNGESIAGLLQSVEAAAEAYQRIAANLAAAPPVAPVAPVVPAGSAAALPIDAEALPAVEKIRRGLGNRR